MHTDPHRLFGAPTPRTAMVWAATAALLAPPALGQERDWRERLLDAAGQVQTRTRAAWADLMAPPEPLPTTFGLHVYDPGEGERAPAWWGLADRPDLPGHVVVLVHGLDEPGGIWYDAAGALAGAGHAVVRFDYPNDQAIAASAAEFRAALGRLAAAGATHVSLVGHSMGGLVALDAITRDAGEDEEALPEVERLITLGTPWAGSPWARVRALGEARDRVSRWLDAPSWDPRPMFDLEQDGDGAAGRDLLPGSPYLAELSARPLPEGVAITAVAGLVARRPAEALEGLASSPYLAELVGPARAESWAQAVRAMGQDVGDGLVSLESALPERVSDRVVVSANHRSLVARLLPGSATPPALPVILDRLESDRLARARPIPAADTPTSAAAAEPAPPR